MNQVRIFRMDFRKFGKNFSFTQVQKIQMLTKYTSNITITEILERVLDYWKISFEIIDKYN
jgi:hypothetical protein